MQSILRPRGPTLNLAIDVKRTSFIQPIQQQEPAGQIPAILPTDSARRETATGQRNGAETPPPEQPPSTPAGAVRFREPEDSPCRSLPAVRVPSDNEACQSTPISGVTSITRMEMTPVVDESRIMTRAEALKVIAKTQSPVVVEAKNTSPPKSDRKRPPPESVVSPRQEKVSIEQVGNAPILLLIFVSRSFSDS